MKTYLSNVKRSNKYMRFLQAQQQPTIKKLSIIHGCATKHELQLMLLMLAITHIGLQTIEGKENITRLTELNHYFSLTLSAG